MKSHIIIEILHSIKDVRLDAAGELQVKFDDSNLVYPSGWESIGGYVNGSFTEQLLLLIEEALQGKLSTGDSPSPNGSQPVI